MSWHNFGPLIALLVLFSLPTIESRSSRGSSHAATKNQMSHREETWMDMMQATQSQQCHTLQPEDRPTEDKLVLAPIVFQGNHFYC